VSETLHLNGIWAAPTTTDKDRKQLLHTLLDEVIVTITADGVAAPSCRSGGKAA
jgi:hypothetical protein